MKLTRESYKKMNAAYNVFFDEWQKIEEMDPSLFNQMNTALVLLDGVLDELKAAAVEENAAQDKPPVSTAGFQVFGGK